MPKAELESWFELSQAILLAVERMKRSAEAMDASRVAFENEVGIRLEALDKVIADLRMVELETRPEPAKKKRSGTVVH